MSEKGPREAPKRHSAHGLIVSYTAIRLAKWGLLRSGLFPGALHDNNFRIRNNLQIGNNSQGCNVQLGDPQCGPDAQVDRA